MVLAHKCPFSSYLWHCVLWQYFLHLFGIENEVRHLDKIEKGIIHSLKIL